MEQQYIDEIINDAKHKSNNFTNTRYMVINMSWSDYCDLPIAFRKGTPIDLINAVVGMFVLIPEYRNKYDLAIVGDIDADSFRIRVFTDKPIYKSLMKWNKPNVMQNLNEFACDFNEAIESL